MSEPQAPADEATASTAAGATPTPTSTTAGARPRPVSRTKVTRGSAGRRGKPSPRPPEAADPYQRGRRVWPD